MGIGGICLPNMEVMAIEYAEMHEEVSGQEISDFREKISEELAQSRSDFLKKILDNPEAFEEIVNEALLSIDFKFNKENYSTEFMERAKFRDSSIMQKFTKEIISKV